MAVYYLSRGVPDHKLTACPQSPPRPLRTAWERPPRCRGRPHRTVTLKLSRADRWKIELFLKSMVAPMTDEPSPSIASQLGTKLRAAESHASQGQNAEAKALYQEVVKAAPGTSQGMEARFRIDAMVPEVAGEPH